MLKDKSILIRKKLFSIFIITLLIINSIGTFSIAAKSQINPNNPFQQWYEIKNVHSFITDISQRNDNKRGLWLDIKWKNSGQYNKEKWYSIDGSTVIKDVQSNDSTLTDSINLDSINTSNTITLYNIMREGNNGTYKKFKTQYNLEGNNYQTIKQLNILEVQPSSNFELEKQDFNSYSSVYEVNLTQMSMDEFISKIENINGKYDIVYIGNKVVHGKTYSTLGEKYSGALPQGNESNAVEYYSEIDITNRRARELKEFIESGQPIVFDESIFNDKSYRATKLFNNFKDYLNYDNSNRNKEY